MSETCERDPGAARWLALAVLLAGGFLAPVDYFIVNVALPSIQAGLGATPAQVQLVISGYASGYAVFLVTGGRLGDLFGRKRLFIFSMAGFVAASMASGLAPTASVLVVARVVQGVAAALLVPQVLGSIRALFSGRDLSRALSAYGAMVGVAAASGQLASGVLVSLDILHLGWRVVFLINLPVGALAILGAIFLVPETSARIRPRLDLGGAALISLTLAALVLPLSEGHQHGWPAWTILSLIACPGLLWAFLRYEDRIGARGGMPLLDLELLRIGSFRRGTLVAMLFFFTSPFYLLFAIERQDGAGLDALHTGLAILPYGIGLFVGSMGSAPFVARFGPRLLSIGMVVEVAGYAATAIATAMLAGSGVLAGTVFLGGFGQGIAMPRLFVTALQDVPARQGGLAAGVVNSMLQIGAAVSVAGVGTLFFAVLGDRSGPVAYAHSFGVAMIAVVAALAGAAFLSRPGASPGRRPA